MRKKLIYGLVIVALVFSVLVLGACASGVSQEDYDAAVAERDAARAEVQTLKAKMTEAVAYAEFLWAFSVGEEKRGEKDPPDIMMKALDDAGLEAIMITGLRYVMEKGITKEEFAFRSLFWIEDIAAYVAARIVKILD